MIDYWQHPVVRLSASNAMCIEALRVGIYSNTGQKVLPACSWHAGKFLFVRSDTCCIGCISFSHKTHRKTSRRKREREFFETENPRVRALIYIHKIEIANFAVQWSVGHT